MSIESPLKDLNTLITGGTGSFGLGFLHTILTEHSPRRAVISSRDELKQYDMKQKWGDDDRLPLALHGVDFVVHAAALKQVDTAEYNPMEYIKTNVLGSENVIKMSVEFGVKKVVALFTGKASSPDNFYGETKLTSDGLNISSNNDGKTRGATFRWSAAVTGEQSPVTDLRTIRCWVALAPSDRLSHSKLPGYDRW